MQHRGFMVPVEGEMYEFWYEGYKDIQNAIGCDCYDSASWVFDDQPACYVDDEGKFNGAMPNRAIYHKGGLVDILFGNMAFCGYDPETGEDRDITDEEIERVVKRFSTHPEEEGSGMREAMFYLGDRLAKGRLRRSGKL